jgi:preprotein translocase subunit SecE
MKTVAEEKEKKESKRTDKRPEKKGGESNFLVRYLRQTRGELRKVTWPTREESMRLTAIVLGVTAVMSIFLGVLDFVFANLVQALVELFS